ncbi:MAG TPA: hypothetical protein VGD10_00465 [Allosphingosinicella sp.]|uniref:hypothetical protein n=1 Tax=Allosphingosinicella sp. TaxID=2823234 RepID=UPI002EDA1491
MPDSPETIGFIRNSFRSVWTLELLLLLRSESRSWNFVELVDRLRASELVVRQGIASLMAGGLVLAETEESVRYAPASPDLDRLADKAAEAYARKPDAIRRLIVLSSTDKLAAFADAFRLRGDKE